jgi:ABC-2 type transport system permease protein
MTESVGATAAPPNLGATGTAAIGTNHSRFWSLLWLTARMEFKLRYHGSLLGFAWTLLHPLLLFGVIYLFFSQVLKVGASIEHYPALLLFNIMLYTYFSQSTSISVTSLVSRERMLRTTEFPRIVIPLSGVLTSTLGLLFGLPVAFLFMLISGVEPMWTWLLTPVVVLLIGLLTLGTTLILSTMYVTVRDISQIWGVAVRALFYGSPVLYVVSEIPESWRPFEYANPIAPILTQARVWLFDPTAPNAMEAGGSLGLWPAAVLLCAIVFLGFWLFIRRATRIAELL